MTYQINAQGFTYTVMDDVTIVYQALVIGSIVDEVTGLPLESPFAVAVDRPDVQARGIPGGLFVVSGYADRVFPDLATTSYSLSLTITADGYRPATVPVTIPVAATLPVSLSPVSLRPSAVRLQGRVVKESDRTPIAGASVACTTSQVLALRTPCYFDHAALTTVSARPLSPAGPPRQLTGGAVSGSTILTLNNPAGLASGQVLLVGDGVRNDYGIIGAPGPGPAQVTLKYGLGRTYAAGAAVQAVTPGGVSGSAHLARDVNAGYGVLLLDAPLSANTIAIEDGPRLEYHALNAISDGAGYYRLDGIGGITALDLKASAGGFTDLPITYAIAYGEPVNIVDFRLLP
jgi:hypothetical protein